MAERNTEALTHLFDFTLSKLLYESPVCINMFIWDMLKWLPLWFMAFYV